MNAPLVAGRDDILHGQSHVII